jgi:glycosyltransferase involved in cell wall biosynthesis
MKPLVSVVIPTFNRVELLKEAIESVLTQSYRPLELVIVDDGSTDSTQGMLEELRPMLIERGMELTAIRNPTNEGCGASLDTGFRAAKGEFISYLGSDDLYIDPDKTSKQVQDMTDRKSDWSYFRDLSVGTNPSDAHLFKPSFVPRMGCLNPVIESRPRLRLLFLLWRNPINSSSFMVRREIYRTFGGWEAWTRNADCDGLLLMKYSYLSLKCSVLDGAPLFYRVHEGQVSNLKSMQKGTAATRDHILCMLKTENASIVYRAFARLFRWLW